MATIDLLGWKLSEAIVCLDKNGYNYTCDEIAVDKIRKDENSCLEKYIVRQQVSSENVYKLLVCTKARKEVR